jgi:hypothetical protein
MVNVSNDSLEISMRNKRYTTNEKVSNNIMKDSFDLKSKKLSNNSIHVQNPDPKIPKLQNKKKQLAK